MAYPTVSFTRPTRGSAPGDIVYTMERIVGGAFNWLSLAEDFVTVSTDPGPGNTETVTVRTNDSLESVPGQLIRLAVSTTP